MLDSLGLAAAIEHHATQFSQRTGIPCQLWMNREEFDLPGDIATAVFRIVQEALTNIARHAAATTANITIEAGEEELRLAVSDDGRGFDATVPKKTFGLLGMHERIALLGGHLDIDSVPGQGTRITGSLPLPQDTSS